MEFRETPSLGVRERVREQFRTFKGYLRTMFGLNERQVVQFQEFSEPKEGQRLEERQFKLTQRIIENLRKKETLASGKESTDFYRREFALTGYSAPEQFLECSGGATFFDEKTQQVKVYLNPYLRLFKPDYQLMVILEEAIHWYQLKRAGRKMVTLADEREAKDRLLEIADFLGFNKQRVEFLQEARAQLGTELEDLHSSVQE